MKRSLASLMRVAAVAAVACALVPSSLAASEYGTARNWNWSQPRYSSPVMQAAPATDFTQRVLTTHNQERSRVGLRPLRWSARLSQEAEQWALTLARSGAFEHADQDDMGENLWMGTASRYSPEQMVSSFLSERRAFRPGRFPNVSNTGNWADVGHYTQIIWPETQQVGCAVARHRGQDVMVCRYWPAGNVYGERVG